MYIKRNTVTDETCSIYQAANLACDAKMKCETCMSFTPGTCTVPKKYYKYSISAVGQIDQESNEADFEQAMMKEIYHRGPITCAIPVPDSLMNYTGGIYEDTTGAEMPEHVISVTGYGIDKPTGKKFWHVRNSWGTYWVSK
jgi:cathepsin X